MNNGLIIDSKGFPRRSYLLHKGNKNSTFEQDCKLIWNSVDLSESGLTGKEAHAHGYIYSVGDSLAQIHASKTITDETEEGYKYDFSKNHWSLYELIFKYNTNILTISSLNDLMNFYENYVGGHMSITCENTTLRKFSKEREHIINWYKVCRDHDGVEFNLNLEDKSLVSSIQRNKNLSWIRGLSANIGIVFSEDRIDNYKLISESGNVVHKSNEFIKIDPNNVTIGFLTTTWYGSTTSAIRKTKEVMNAPVQTLKNVADYMSSGIKGASTVASAVTAPVRYGYRYGGVAGAAIGAIGTAMSSYYLNPAITTSLLSTGAEYGLHYGASVIGSGISALVSAAPSSYVSQATSLISAANTAMNYGFGSLALGGAGYASKKIYTGK